MKRLRIYFGAAVLLAGASAAPVIPESNGLISAVVFSDGVHEIEFQMPDAQYQKMGQIGGHDFNPTINDLAQAQKVPVETLSDYHFAYAYQYPAAEKTYTDRVFATSSNKVVPVVKQRPDYKDVDGYESLLEFLTPEAKAAIAYDNSAKGSASATSLTFALTTSGSNRFLVVNAYSNAGISNWTATYNGTSMTRTFNCYAGPDTDCSYIFILAAPTAGANNVVISSGSSTGIQGLATSYTGVSQTGQPDATGSNSANGAGHPNTASITVVAANSWVVAGANNDNNQDMTAGSGMTQRQLQGAQASINDSNGTVSTGAFTVNINFDNRSGSWEIVAVSLAPAADVAPSAPAIWPQLPF